MKSQSTFHSLEDLSALSDSPKSVSTPATKQHDGKGKSVRVLLDKSGRKGKTVTLVVGLQHNPVTMEELARTLKQHCGAGGTVKDGAIEIQGDQRERVTEKLTALHYTIQKSK
ncbi:MAG TPA: translation initiation factor [Bacteroidota bacterium]|nr:translation initiation factor [Bacteroidota bacterium]